MMMQSVLSGHPDDSESTGSSVGTDDQPATPSQPARRGAIQSAVPTHMSPDFNTKSGVRRSHRRWSDFEASDNSSLDSFIDMSIHERNPIEAEGTQADREYEKTLIKRAHLSNEYLRLSSLLRTNSSKKIINILQEKLQRKDSKSIVALSILLPRSEFPPSGDVHCVRCHKNFNPKNDSQCVIRHPNYCVKKISEDSNGARFHCRACSTHFDLSMMHFYNEHVNAYLSGYCYNGHHAVNPCHVTYDGAIRTCEENGCVEFYV